jgi:acyl carrier protein
VLISFLYLFIKGNEMSDNISDKVKSIISDKLGVDISKVTDEARFIDDFGADSLDTVDLVMALEESFGIEITDKEGQNILSVKEAIAFIKSKSGHKE